MHSSTVHRLGAAAGSVIALVAAAMTFTVFVTSYSGQEADEHIMRQWAGVWGVDSPTSGWLGENQMTALAGFGLVIAAVCAYRRSPRLILHAAVVVLGAVIAAVFLKYGLQRPSFGIGTAGNSFPSNTVAAFVAAAIALVSVVPQRAKAVVTLGGGLGAVLVSAAVVALQWHRPSDVIGGWLIAVAAGCAAHALVPLGAEGRRRGSRLNSAAGLHAVRS